MRERRKFAMLKATEQICRTQVGTDLGLIRLTGSRPRPNWAQVKKKRSPNRLISMPRKNRSMLNRSHGTKAKSEKAHIEADEMLDAVEVHYMCFGEFIRKELLSSACGLMKLRNGPAKAQGAKKTHDEAEKDQTEAKVAFDLPWMCRTH